MDIKDIIALSVGGIILVGGIIYLICNQRQKIQEWLKYAVTEAEKMLGGGTGQLKLRMVYDWFCDKFRFISAIMPFRVFSAWVDTALKTLDIWLTNSKVVSYVGSDSRTKKTEKDK